MRERLERRRSVGDRSRPLWLDEDEEEEEEKDEEDEEVNPEEAVEWLDASTVCFRRCRLLLATWSDDLLRGWLVTADDDEEEDDLEDREDDEALDEDDEEEDEEDLPDRRFDFFRSSVGGDGDESLSEEEELAEDSEDDDEEDEEAGEGLRRPLLSVRFLGDRSRVLPPAAVCFAPACPVTESACRWTVFTCWRGFFSPFNWWRSTTFGRVGGRVGQEMGRVG